MRTIEKFKQYLKKKNLSTMNNRKKVGIILFTTSIGLFFLFVARLSYIVIVGQVAGESLEVRTQNLYQGSQIVNAKRGGIYDRNGVAITEDATSYTLYAVLNESYVTGSGDNQKNLYAEEENFNTLADIIVDVLGERADKKSILAVLQQGAEDQLWQVNIPNARNITLQESQAIQEAMDQREIAGLYFDDHPSRIYPNGVFSSHLIGYADVEVDEETKREELIGKMGIEQAYEDVLRGKDGKVIFQKDRYQNPLPGTVAESDPAEDGQDIYTTLDSRLQNYSEALMDEAWKETEAEDLTMVMMKAKTGEIVAMSQRPTFNPESKEEGFSEENFLWQNLFIEDSYEPGSTMKMFTVAAAIDQGVFNPNETYSTQELMVIDTPINDWDLGATHATLSMRNALSWSSNIGMVKLEQKMPERWQRYLEEFGFGRSTYSGLWSEHTGNLPEDNIVSRSMTSFGQAIGVSQFQMLQAMTAIGNDGVMVKPQFVKKIVNPTTGEEIVTQTEVVGNPISAEAAKTVREYMRDTVESESYGTAYGVYELPDYNISVKTGTAEMASDGNYSENDYLYSVVSMFPSEDPEYILYITLKRPQEQVASRIFQMIANPLMKRAMDLYDVDMIEQTSEVSTEMVSIQDYRNLETTAAAEDANRRGLAVTVVGDGELIKSQSTPNGRQVMPGTRLILLTDSEQYYMPDLTGWSKADLVKFGELLNIEVLFEGEGYCVGQNIEPYELITDEAITFTLDGN